ncbi:MAG: Lrp/AsnC family transcriptional regulator [Pseudomonadota bacterium]
MQFDKRDMKILAILQNNCRISNGDLAEQVGMSASACWRRVKMFEEAGVIERYGAVINQSALGLAFSAIVHVQLTRHDPEAMKDFNKAIARSPEIQSCYATTGQADYHLLVRCKDIEAYNTFLEDFLFQLPAVRGAQTNVVLKDIKSGLTI